MQAPALSLPADLPHLPLGKEYPLSWNRTQIEKELNDLLSKGIWPENTQDSDELLLFFKTVAQDFTWMNKHQAATEKVFHAASRCLFNPSLATKGDKIKAIVSDHLLVVGSYLPKDMQFKVGQTVIRDSALALASGSPFFETMFRSRPKEGGGESMIELKSVDPQVFELFAFILHHGYTPKDFKATDDILMKVFVYAEQVGSLEKMIPILDPLLKNKNFDEETAVELYAYASSPLAPHLRKSCFDSLASMANTPQKLAQLVSLIHRYEPLEDRASLIEQLDKHLKIAIDIKTIQEWYNVASTSNLPLLKRNCLALVYKNLSLEKATEFARHAYTEPSMALAQGVYINTADREAYCRDVLIGKAAEWFAVLEHKWDPAHQNFDGTAKKLMPGFLLSKEKKEAIQHLKDLQPTLKTFYNLSNFALDRFTPRELAWVLQSISSDSTQLDLSGSKVESLRLLNRFKNLESLDLQNCLQVRNLSGKLNKLKYLDIRDCPALFDYKKIGKYTDLEQLLIKSDNIALTFEPLRNLSQLKLVDLRGSDESVKSQANKLPKEARVVV